MYSTRTYLGLNKIELNYIDKIIYELLYILFKWIRK